MACWGWFWAGIKWNLPSGARVLSAGGVWVVDESVDRDRMETSCQTRELKEMVWNTKSLRRWSTKNGLA